MLIDNSWLVTLIVQGVLSRCVLLHQGGSAHTVSEANLQSHGDGYGHNIFLSPSGATQQRRLVVDGCLRAEVRLECWI